MKKSFILGISIILLGLAFILIGAIFGGFNKGKEVNFDYDSKYKNIIISGNFDVKKSKDNKIHLTYSEIKDRYVKITGTEDEDLKIEIIYNYPWYKKFININLFGNEDKAVELYLPDDNNLNLKAISDNEAIKIKEIRIGNLDVDFNNGYIEINDLKANDVDLKSRNGAIKISEIIADNLKAESRNGLIVLNDIKVDNSEVITENGKINVDDAVGDTLILSTRNGKIDLEDIDIDKKIDASTRNGSINLELKGKIKDYSFDIKSENAIVSYDGKKNYDFESYTGETEVKLSIVNGRINIKN